MKRLLTNTMIASAFALLTIPAFAGNTNISPMNAQDTVVEEEKTTEELLLAQTDVVYTDIEVSEIPEAVATAVGKDYEGCAIEKAAKGSDNSYRLQIKNGNKVLCVYYDENGKFLKEEALEPEALMILG